MLKHSVKIAVCLAFSLFSPHHAGGEYKVVFKGELAYYGDVIFKFWPSYTLRRDLENVPKLELLLGKPFALGPVKFVVYAELKTDLNETVYIGPRLAPVFNVDRTFFGLEGAYFMGLNDRSDNFFRVVPYVLYKATDKLNVGILNIGDYYNDEQLTSLGPLVSYSFNKNVNVLLRYGTDFEGENRVDFRVSYRFGKGRKGRATP